MSEFKAVLFDADGVLVTPQTVFSLKYAEKFGLDPTPFPEFFKGVFEQALVGKADLKELIITHSDVWHWNKDPQELLDMWFSTENVLDPDVVEIIKQLRDGGVPTYLATNQEKYRATYMREVMFPDIFDDLFISSELGYTKKEQGYWTQAIGRIALTIPSIQPAEIIYFDDSQDSIDGALKAGISAHLYENPAQIHKLLGL